MSSAGTADGATDGATDVVARSAPPTSLYPTVTELASVALPPAGVRNEQGVELRLDEAASLACAHAEFALDELDLGAVDRAVDEARRASDRAASSSVQSFRAAAPGLAAAAADSTGARLRPLVTDLLSSCETNGHQR